MGKATLISDLFRTVPFSALVLNKQEILMGRKLRYLIYHDLCQPLYPLSNSTDDVLCLIYKNKK